MSDGALSPQQLTAMASSVRLIEAGPGSGKTRTVVERYRRAASVPGQFASLVSFTNSAVEEVRKRCANEPQVLQAPNFVGTFDAFFHRFVTTPAFIRAAGRQPRYVTSWDELPDHLSRLRPTSGGTGVSLTAFELATDGSVQVVAKRLSRVEEAVWSRLTNYARQAMEAKAQARLVSLGAAGIMSAETARTFALATLVGEEGPRILKSLRVRFCEMIVDEFQDCNENDIQLLELLSAQGLPIVAVADPDQAIYQFRQRGGGDLYEAFRGTLAPESVVRLNECHRSSEAICKIVTSVRSVSPDPVVASTKAPAGSPFVYVFSGSRSDVIAKANTVLQGHGISQQNSRVVAHKSNEARRLIHHRPGLTGESNARWILHGLLELRSRNTATHRLAALDRISRLLLSAVEKPEPVRSETMGETMEGLGIDPVVFRILAGRLVTASSNWKIPDDYATSLTTVISEGFFEFGLTPRKNLRVAFPKPKADLWDRWLKQVDGLFNDSSLGWQWSNIHQVKGGEFDAILIPIPSQAYGTNPHALDDWENGTNSEQRRVLYVGVSRAKRLLMIWPEGQRLAQLRRILERDDVPHQVV